MPVNKAFHISFSSVNQHFRSPTQFPNIVQVLLLGRQQAGPLPGPLQEMLPSGFLGGGTIHVPPPSSTQASSPSPLLPHLPIAFFFAFFAALSHSGRSMLSAHYLVARAGSLGCWCCVSWTSSPSTRGRVASRQRVCTRQWACGLHDVFWKDQRGKGTEGTRGSRGGKPVRNRDTERQINT